MFDSKRITRDMRCRQTRVIMVVDSEGVARVLARPEPGPGKVAFLVRETK